MTGNPESDSGCGPAFPDPCIRIIPEKEISGIAGYSFHRGVLGYAIRPRERSVTELLPCVAKRYHEGFAAQGSLILALPEIIDPENLGASFRNAAAFGCTSLLLGPHCPDPLSRRVLRVSMGAAMSLPWARMRAPDCLDAFRRAGFTLAACVLDPDATDLRTWRRPPLLVLALGNEAFGLSPEWLAACTDRLILPMGSGTDSLNVATAGAVFLYALTCPDRERHREC